MKYILKKVLIISLCLILVTSNFSGCSFLPADSGNKKKDGKTNEKYTGYEDPIIEEDKENKKEKNTPDSEYDTNRINIGITEENIAKYDAEFSNLYAYSVMDRSLHNLYIELYIIIMNEAENIKVSTNDADQLKYAFKCVFADHPEIYWIEGYSYVSHEKNRENSFMTFTGKYTYTPEERSVKRVQIDSYYASFLSGINKATSEYDKVKYTYEYVIKNTDYVLDSQDSQNILSVFVNKKSVCQGYAKAIQYLLQRVGVECTFVTGRVDTGEGHGWNLVNIDGAYYYLDATWGDSSYILNDFGSGYDIDINYDYLNITTEELLINHIIDNVVPMPSCVSTEANYYYHENLVFAMYDYEGIKAVFDKAYANRDKYVLLKGYNVNSYNEIVAELIDNQGLFNMVSADTEKISYVTNDEKYYIIIWL